MSIEKPIYIEEYDTFIKECKEREVSSEEVGRLITRMAVYYSECNLGMVETAKKLSFIARDFEMKTDETTGKPVSSSKAKVFTDATNEAYEYNKARAHVENVEQIINALKALQRSLIIEYGNSSI